MLRVALTELRKIPKLQQCDPYSFMGGVLACAQLGLEPGGALGHVYLIPYGQNVNVILGYKGMIELARRSGQIVSLYAHAVYEKDDFTYELGLNENLVHKPKLSDRGEMIAVYAVAHLVGGGHQIGVMSKEDVEKVRRKSAQSNSPAWKDHYDEMAKKGLDINTKIPTPNGWSTMLKLEVGDNVFDMNGEPTKVIAVSEIKNLPCYKLTFTNGESLICDDEHKWVARIGCSNAYRDEYSAKTINEMYDALEDGLSVTIPMQGKLDLPDVKLPLDPYLLGYWLGDGSTRRSALTVGYQDLDFVLEQIEKSNYILGKVRKDERAESFNVGIKGGFLYGLKQLNLIQNKHIPPIYLRASAKQRRALLQGLMDSDGHIDKQRGRAHFYNTNKELIDGFSELVYSLGEHVHTTTKRMYGFNTSCVAHAVFWKPSFLCVRNPRKIENYQPRKIAPYRSIKSIEKIPSVPTKCIAVDSPSKTYLAGNLMAVTHNTVLRRLFKYLPVSIEIQKAVAMDDASEAGKFDGKYVLEGELEDGIVFDSETGEVKSDEGEPKTQADELVSMIK